MLIQFHRIIYALEYRVQRKVYCKWHTHPHDPHGTGLRIQSSENLYSFTDSSAGRSTCLAFSRLFTNTRSAWDRYKVHIAHWHMSRRQILKDFVCTTNTHAHPNTFHVCQKFTNTFELMKFTRWCLGSACKIRNTHTK